MKTIEEFELVEELTRYYWRTDKFIKHFFTSVFRTFTPVSLLAVFMFMDFLMSFWLGIQIKGNVSAFHWMLVFEAILLICVFYLMYQYAKKLYEVHLSPYEEEYDIQKIIGVNYRVVFHLYNFIEQCKKSEKIMNSTFLDEAINNQLKTIISSLQESNITIISKFERVLRDPVFWGVIGIISALILSSLTFVPTLKNDYVIQIQRILWIFSVVLIFPLIYRAFAVATLDEVLQKKKAFLAFYFLKKINKVRLD
ncbi:hypothetical protein [Hydrogenovibrio sp. JE_KL2]|uniref:hypothetical protein n=1 Tax=Hydrogenovibrio sp. JE_KL2 TaxID=2651188 RepID=UPI00128D807A|nr:hypothetical protein [Hydrogenovibrio sp. JE_KL2]MPQ75722.1 hypothetical protein [Hydrogenovibrio sp. JE_KL2]